jgi:mannose-1-phosphate guanylyltransferase
MQNYPLIPIILCGGVGSRLWPISREMYPKPFIKLNDGQSLLQKAFFNASIIPNISKIFTITNRELLFKIKDEYKNINYNKIPLSFILEPFGRGTAAAIAAATLYLIKENENSILIILNSDHLIQNKINHIDAIKRAITLAE